MRILKWLLILGVLSGLGHYVVQRQRDHNLDALVADTRAKLPIEIAPGLQLTDVQYADARLSFTGRFTALHAVDPAQQRFAQDSLVRNYCSGSMKLLRDRGVSVEYNVGSQAFGEPPTVTHIAATPTSCPQ